MIISRALSVTKIRLRFNPRTLAHHVKRYESGSSDRRDEESLKDDINLSGIHLDDIDKILSFGVLEPFDPYPRLDLDPLRTTRPFQGHNVMVIQPWEAFMNFGRESTDPELQLKECVSLCNTIQDWQVVAKKIVFSRFLNKKHVFGKNTFAELKEDILGRKNVSATVFGVEVLSGVQLKTIEHELKMPCYDRFTVVLNIFRQHARTSESKIQIALAELSYIRANLREIHESSEFSSTNDSLKTMIGGLSEKYYHRRLSILKRREHKLKLLLDKIRQQRQVTSKLRRKSNMPIVSVVGYTNCGKTSLIKHLTCDESLIPKDQLFATLDVTAHTGSLPSAREVIFMDTVGFLSRIPILLIEAFSATLKDAQDSDLIIHVLDITHPDSRLQYATVINALESIKINRSLIRSKITVGNKIDLISEKQLDDLIKTQSVPRCDVCVSVTDGTNMSQLVEAIDRGLSENLNYLEVKIRVSNGGAAYTWLRKNSTIKECKADESDGNFLVCLVSMSPTCIGRWSKRFGLEGVLTNVQAFEPKKSLF